MGRNVVELSQYRKPRPSSETEDAKALAFFRNLPLGFTVDHCAKARSILNWSVEALAFRSGVSIKAIQQFEGRTRDLRRVSLQALAFSFEAEGLIFLPGIDPMTGDNARGATEDPRTREDYHLLE